MSPSIYRSDICNDDVPILIIGAGPSGLFLAYMLEQLGVPSLIIERYEKRLAAPKAHALSPRSLEICRQFGLDVNKIRKMGTGRRDAYWVNFVTSLAGRQVGRLPYERMDAKVLDDTPTMIHNISQPDFEKFVASRLAKSSLVEIRKNHTFLSLEEGEDHVITTIENRTTKEKYKIRSEHVVACDGAKSAVRKFLGIQSEGEDSYETMMTIHFNADLRPIVKENVGMLHWIMDPLVSGFIICYDLSGNQVLICNFDSKKYPVESWNEDHCRKVVDAAIGTDVKYDILSYRPWILSRKVANSYRTGRVFLAGDAAHSFPPTGGLGLNSGLGDVHNLAYKLAAVYHGRTNSSLLDTYESERRHVALVNSQQSVKNGKKIFGLLKALGTTNHDLEIARQNLYEKIQDIEAMKEIAQGIEGQREHFDNLALHIGYVYGENHFPENASDFQATCVPGARLPHAWVKLENSDLAQLPAIDCGFVDELSVEKKAQMKFSTLDLCRFDSFTILLGEEIVSRLQPVIKEALKNISMQLPSPPSLEVRVQGVDFWLQPGQEKWNAITKLSQGRVILIRPDQHILAIFDGQLDSEALVNVLRNHLGW